MGVTLRFMPALVAIFLTTEIMAELFKGYPSQEQKSAFVRV
jgi:hypothetical protein